MNEKPLSIAEAFELTPETWINDGVQGVAASIENKKSKAGKPYWRVTLRDETGSAQLGLSMFFAPKFGEGDLIEITGKGIKRGEYNGNAEISIGKDSKINTVGKSVHADEQQQRAATLQPAVNGTRPHIEGQTVGMAMKEAIALLTIGMERDELDAVTADPKFFRRIWEVSSHLVRVSCYLKAGHMAPKLGVDPDGVTNSLGHAAPAPQAAPPPKQEPARQAKPAPTDIDEDVPF